VKTVSAGYLAYRTTATSTRDWHFLKVTREDGEIFGFTNGDRRKLIDGVWYEPGFRAFAVQDRSDLMPGNTEVEGGLSSDGITEDDIRAGKWDRAYWEYFRAKWDNLALGIEKIGNGYLGEITRGRTAFTTDLLTTIKLLDQQIGRVVEPACDADLGDSRCKVRLDPPAWAATTAYTVRQPAEAGSGSVVKPTTPNDRHFKCTTAGTSGGSEPAWNLTIGGTTNDGSVVWMTIQALTVIGDFSHVTSRSVFRDSARTEAVSFFDQGSVTITSGENEGLTREVKSYAVDGTFTLQLPFPYDVAVGDDYEATAGCRFRFSEDCTTVFDNANNFRGFPHVPGVDFLSSGKVGEAA
jgi:hypothetical protein